MEHDDGTATEEPTDDVLLDVASTCDALGGIGRTTLYRLIAAGEIKTVKLGARTMTPRSEVNRLIARRMANAA